jgi:CO dehydrogenase nickel-insertion accessory protein CooC1
MTAGVDDMNLKVIKGCDVMVQICVPGFDAMVKSSQLAQAIEELRQTGKEIFNFNNIFVLNRCGQEEEEPWISGLPGAEDVIVIHEQKNGGLEFSGEVDALLDRILEKRERSRSCCDN